MVLAQRSELLRPDDSQPSYAVVRKRLELEQRFSVLQAVTAFIGPEDHTDPEDHPALEAQLWQFVLKRSILV